MTPQILDWLKLKVAPHLTGAERVVEVGSYNVNGSARDALQYKTADWVGIDRVAGPCVDVVDQASEWLRQRNPQFDVVISCEAYEHDPEFWITNEAARAAVKSGGLYVVTTPTIGFPYHSYGGDFYRFTEDTYRQVFFKGFEIIDLSEVRDASGAPCIVGLAKRPLQNP